MLESEEPALYVGRLPVRVRGPADSLFVWDSHTVHQNVPPTAHGSVCMASYLSYQPATWATAVDLQAKRAACAAFQTTMHWAAASVQRTRMHVG